MDLQLADKKALVTGSSKGIGEAIARTLAREGATVVVHGRDLARALRVAAEIRDGGGRAVAVRGDLTEEAEVDELVQEVLGQVGPPGIIVNNAGGSGGSTQTWTSTDTTSWAKAYDRNVLAAVRITSRFLPEMTSAGWGRVINISSLAGQMPPPSAPDYSACKAAINAMTVSLSKAVAKDGITVNAISPGTIHSATLDSRFREIATQNGLVGEDAPWEEVERQMLPLIGNVPVGRVGRLEELANVVAFLASPLASYITGSNLRVDGGMLPST